MRTYTVYFEIFGKKMKTRVLSESREKAKEVVKSKIVFHKIESDNGKLSDDLMDEFDKIVDILS